MVPPKAPRGHRRLHSRGKALRDVTPAMAFYPEARSLAGMVLRRSATRKKIREAGKIQQLVRFLGDKDPFIRANAVVHVAKLVQREPDSSSALKEARAMLKPLQKDTNAKVRRNAIRWREFLVRTLKERVAQKPLPRVMLMKLKK